MRLGVSLAGFAAAAETTNVAGRAVEFGSQAGRPGLDSVWLPGRTSCPQQRRPDASEDSTPRAPCRPWRSGDGAAGLAPYGGVFIQTLRNRGPWRPCTQASGSPESARRQASRGIVDPGLSLDYVTTVLAALLVGTGFVLQQHAAAM